jgi:hypothetical protein
MSTPAPTYYELLGIKPDATEAEIKSAFRREAKRNHPDQGGNPALFHLIEEAYEVLVDPTSRAIYDDRRTDLMATPPHGVYMNRDPDDPSFHDVRQEEPTQQWTSAQWQHGASEADQDAPQAPQEEWAWMRFSESSAADARPPFWERAAERFTWLRVIIGVALIYMIFAFITGSGILPAGDIASLLLAAMFAWIFGSLVLRIVGIGLVVWALADAHWFDAPGGLTLERVGIGFAIWLCGHWLFTWRNGEWRSMIAHNVLSKLPKPLRPDRN